mgnify:CR=1 FL=1|tara:strand:+ start:889 stop:1056 length:168 start_codon:yes stop_codon:yes gene_type:complete
MTIDFNTATKPFHALIEAFDSSVFEGVVAGVLSRQVMNDPNAVNQYISIVQRLFG